MFPVFFVVVSPHLSDFCFSVGRSCARWTCSDGGSPLGPPWTRGRSGAELPQGAGGGLVGSGGDAALGHLSVGHQLLSPPPLPRIEGLW